MRGIDPSVRDIVLSGRLQAAEAIRLIAWSSRFGAWVGLQSDGYPWCRGWPLVRLGQTVIRRVLADAASSTSWCLLRGFGRGRRALWVGSVVQPSAYEQADHQTDGQAGKADDRFHDRPGFQGIRDAHAEVSIGHPEARVVDVREGGAAAGNRMSTLADTASIYPQL